MNTRVVDGIVNTVLYEGHILYPYRPSSIKNRRRFTFGRIYPRAYSRLQGGKERCTMTTECVFEAKDGPTGEAKLEIGVRFLQPIRRQVFDAEREPVERLDVDGTAHLTWQEVLERSVLLPITSAAEPHRFVHAFAFPDGVEREELKERHVLRGTIERRREQIEGRVTMAIEPLSDALFKVSVEITNESPCSDDAGADEDTLMLHTMASTHTILHVEGGRFFSLTDPPAEHAEAVTVCTNDGTWPVLVGDRDRADTILSSPIILYDYPEIAPESAGDLFDGTEIDEILTLRIMTMTDEEKDEMRSVDEFARKILHRTERLEQDDLMGMHGTFRDLRSLAEEEAPRFADARGRRLEVGDRVRIRPKGRSDVMDAALTGRSAEIESIEQDFDGRIYLALVFDDDPGRDLGLMRQPGHRFFYTIDEVEPVEEERHES